MAQNRPKHVKKSALFYFYLINGRILGGFIFIGEWRYNETGRKAQPLRQLSPIIQFKWRTY